MTEGEWLESTNPAPMLEFLRGGMVLIDVSVPSGKVLKTPDWPKDKRNDRKLRLFTVACCQMLLEDLTDERHRDAVRRVERIATIAAELPEQMTAEQAMQFTARLPNPEEADRLINGLNSLLALTAEQLGRVMARYITGQPPTSQPGKELEAAALRDIFGNPFRPLPPRPEAIAPLAEQIYAGAWDKMPRLGEWLQEHGYATEGEHCLDPNNHHVKGCWVVDWLTGRE